MQAISATLAALLAKRSRAATAEIAIQLPNPSNALQMGSQILLDGLASVTINKNEDPTSDTLDFEISNPDGRYSPVQSAGNISPIVYNPYSY